MTIVCVCRVFSFHVHVCLFTWEVDNWFCQYSWIVYVCVSVCVCVTDFRCVISCLHVVLKASGLLWGKMSDSNECFSSNEALESLDSNSNQVDMFNENEMCKPGPSKGMGNKKGKKVGKNMKAITMSIGKKGGSSINVDKAGPSKDVGQSGNSEAIVAAYDVAFLVLERVNEGHVVIWQPEVSFVYIFGSFCVINKKVECIRMHQEYLICMLRTGQMLQ